MVSFSIALACQSAVTQSSKVNGTPVAVTSEESGNSLDKAVKKYSLHGSIKIDLIKIVKLKLLDRVDESRGVAFLKGKNKIRIEFSEPQKTIAVLSGKKGWVIEYPPKGIDDKVRVSRFQLQKTPGQAQLLMSSLLSGGDLLKNFTVKSQKSAQKSESRLTAFQLSPKKSDQEIKQISILVEEEKSEIAEFSYVDALDNETTFKFLKIDFQAKIENKMFEYSIPKGAEVNEF